MMKAKIIISALSLWNQKKKKEKEKKTAISSRWIWKEGLKKYMETRNNAMYELEFLCTKLT